MRGQELRAQRTKSKDVELHKNVSRARASKKSAEMLPKILAIAARNGSLQTQRVRCGKANCKCARGELHNGYSYFFWRLGGRQLKWYVRREDVPAVRAVINDRASRNRAWRAELSEARAFLRRLMSAAVGVRI